MGKKKKNFSRSVEKKVEKSLSSPSFWQKNRAWLYPTILAFFALVCFWPISFGGYRTAGYDSVSSGENLNKQWQDATGEKVYYDLSIFSGTPGYAFVASEPKAYSAYYFLKLHNLLGNGGLYMLMGVLGFFFLLRHLKIGRMAAFFASLGFTLIPHWGVLFAIGHIWKYEAVLLIPFCLLFYLKLFDKPSVKNLVFFSFFQVWQIQRNHYQIIYYTAMLIGFVSIVKIIEYRKDFQRLFKSAVFIFLAAIIVVGVTFQPMYLTQEYSKYTIRGAKTEDGRTGLTKSYATSWSLSPKELLALLIPRAFGGASGERYDVGSPDYPQLAGRDIPGYWGDMPFTQGTDYAGIVLVFLAFIGVILNWHKGMVKSFAFLAILAVFLAFGRHFSLVYDLFFNFVPGFNKFRVPSMILILVEFLLAVLAGYGLNDILQNKKERLWKVVLINFFAFLSIGLLVLIFSGQFSFSSPADRYDAQTLMIIKNIRKEFLISDSLRYLFYLVLTFGLITAYLKNWLKKKTVFLVLILGLMLIDFLQIQNRFLFKKVRRAM